MNKDIYITILEEQKFSPASNDLQSMANLDQSPHLDSNPPFACDFCKVPIDHLSKINVVDRTLHICQACFLSHEDQIAVMELWKEIVTVKEGGRVIKVTSESSFKPYDLCRGTCPLCNEENQLLFKVGRCCHYICRLCLSEQVSGGICPVAGCWDKITDYLLIQYERNSQIVKPYMLCANQNCDCMLKVNPYSNLEAVSVQLDGDRASCSLCKLNFCARCWTKHKGKCDFNRLFRESVKANKIVKCPRCNTYGIPQFCRDDGVCAQYKASYQQCPLCNYSFCYDCRGPLEGYEAQDNQTFYSCRKCKAHHNSLAGLLARCLTRQSLQVTIMCTLYMLLVVGVLILMIGGLSAVFLYLALKQLAQVYRFTLDFLRNHLCRGMPRMMIWACSPIWAPLTLALIIVVYVVTFIPLLINNLRNIYDNF